MTDDSTVSGLLKKRDELQRESASLREQMAIVSNSIDAIDQVLESFGFEGELEGKTPRAARVILFYRNELREYLLGELRKASGPLSSRQLASMVCQCEGKDAKDRRLVADITRRVGCALRRMRAVKMVHGYRDKSGAAVWSIESRF
jgi:hypothetical protein